jgi:parvulin-like peptidyl-prolyl isomerase
MGVLVVVILLVAACRAPNEAATPDVTAVPAETPTVSPDDQAQARARNVDLAMDNLQRPEGNAIATVNGQQVPLDRYLDFMRLRLHTITDQYQIDWSDENSVAMLGQLENDVIDQLVNMELLRQVAADEGLLPTQEEIQDMSDEIQAEVLAYGEYADWEAFKTQNQLTDAVFVRIVEESIILEKMIDRYAQVGEVEQVNAAHILVDDEETAQDLLEQIRGGADFAELAQEHSQDPGSAQQGGDLGWFPQGVMVGEFEDAAFALQVGEVSEVVRTDFGFHIIKVMDREVRPMDPYLEQEFQNRMFSAWLDDLYNRADIEVHVDQGS